MKIATGPGYHSVLRYPGPIVFITDKIHCLSGPGLPFIPERGRILCCGIHEKKENLPENAPANEESRNYVVGAGMGIRVAVW